LKRASSSLDQPHGGLALHLPSCFLDDLPEHLRVATTDRIGAALGHATILSSIEVGIVLAIIGCVVAQMLGGDAGLGHLLMAKMNAYETDSLFAVLMLLAWLGCCFHFAVRALRRVVVPWHGSAG
jgi:ABC-type nitrate/sulfonate/bicarbonate transport system permease component